MQISRKAKPILLSAAILLLAVTIVLVIVLSAKPEKITDPAKFAGDHGVYVIANGSYDQAGSIVLKSVADGDNGWKQFVFSLAPSAKINDLYILPLKAGISVDEVFLFDGSIDASLQSQFAKPVAKANFDSIDSPGPGYGFELSEEAIEGKGKCIKAADTASKILYFIKGGKAVDSIVYEGDVSLACESYELSIWVKYEWSGIDYDNLFYIGVNEVESETTAE